MIDQRTVEELLAQRRIAVVGASEKRDSFGRTIYRAFRDHGYDVVAVNPSTETVDGDPCFADLAHVPGALDAAVVVVNADAAADVVRACIERGVPRVWLFQGIGGAGAVSEEAVQLCEAHGISVVAGACPMMFLEPVGWFHRLHRGARRANGSLSRTP